MTSKTPEIAGCTRVNTYLTIQEVMTAYEVSYQAVYQAVKSGKIEAYKPGRVIMLDSKSVDSWFKASKIQARRPIGRPRKHETRGTV